MFTKKENNLFMGFLFAVVVMLGGGGCDDFIDADELFTDLTGSIWEPSTTEKYDLPPLETVDEVDLNRYVGTWYEIAHFPQRFQEGCTGTTATYTRRDDGDIDVVNRCFKGSLDGEEDTARGRARVVDSRTNAKLEVSFFGPFWGDYWIIDLDSDYQYAVVGHPSRDYLWILSRTATMEQGVYDGIISRLVEKSYPLDRLKKTVQPGMDNR